MTSTKRTFGIGLVPSDEDIDRRNGDIFEACHLHLDTFFRKCDLRKKKRTHKNTQKHVKNQSELDCGFKHFLCSSLFGEMIQFD